MKFAGSINENGIKSLAVQAQKFGLDWDIQALASEIGNTISFLDAIEGQAVEVEIKGKFFNLDASQINWVELD